MSFAAFVETKAFRRDGPHTEDGTKQSTTKGFEGVKIDANNNQPREE
jgi:hypothetical protein